MVHDVSDEYINIGDDHDAKRNVWEPFSFFLFDSQPIIIVFLLYVFVVAFFLLVSKLVIKGNSGSFFSLVLVTILLL